MKPAVTHAIYLVIIAILGYFLYHQITSVTSSTDIGDLQKKNADYEVQFKQLNDQISQAHTVTSVKQVTIDSLLKALDRTGAIAEAYKRMFKDSLDESHRLIGIAYGSAHVDLSGGGQLHDSTFEDDWVHIKVAPLVSYELLFDVGDVQAEVRDSNNNQSQLYTVYLQSRRNPEHYKILPFERTVFVEKPYYPLIRWWNPAINFNLEFGGEHVEGGLTFSMATVGASKESKAIIFLFPDVGFSSDFAGTTNIVGGGRFNLGHYIPLFSDLDIAPHIGFPVNHLSLNNMCFRIAIGTTL